MFVLVKISGKPGSTGGHGVAIRASSQRQSGHLLPRWSLWPKSQGSEQLCSSRQTFFFFLVSAKLRSQEVFQGKSRHRFAGFPEQTVQSLLFVLLMSTIPHTGPAKSMWLFEPAWTIATPHPRRAQIGPISYKFLQVICNMDQYGEKNISKTPP